MKQITPPKKLLSGCLKRTANDLSAGFTIIEVLIAITIFSIGILAVITMQITGVNGNVRAQSVGAAVNQAAGRMELILAADYNGVVDGAGTSIAAAGLNDGGINAGTVADGSAVSGIYSIYWNVAEDIPALNCKTIRVLVVNNQLQSLAPVSMDFVKVKDL